MVLTITDRVLNVETGHVSGSCYCKDWQIWRSLVTMDLTCFDVKAFSDHSRRRLHDLELLTNLERDQARTVPN